MRQGTDLSGAILDILHTVRRVTPGLRRTCGLGPSPNQASKVSNGALADRRVSQPRTGSR
jgi:hypothetical protein